MTEKKKYFEKSKKHKALFSAELYVKLSFTIFFVAIFIISFFVFNGIQYFYSTTYANDLRGHYFQIHTIDVGQGDCFLIKFPNNECMLIDTGERKYKNEVCDYISQFLEAEQLSKIDYLLLTHPDSDHIGNAKSVLKSFDVETLLRPPLYSYNESLLPVANENFAVDNGIDYDEIIIYAYDNNIQIKTFSQGMTLYFGDCVAEFLSPKIKSYSSNNYSAVIMFAQQGKKFLFMGDAEEEIENELIEEYSSQLKADVLKVGHHGSSTSTSQNFLNVVNPEFALLSSGGNSKYLPSSIVLNRLKNLHVRILSTVDLGNFVVGIKNNKIMYFRAQSKFNYVSLIFSIVLILVFIVWKSPFKKSKPFYFTKKD